MYCINCGNKLKRKDKFCRKCGEKVSAGQEEMLNGAMNIGGFRTGDIVIVKKGTVLCVALVILVLLGVYFLKWSIASDNEYVTRYEWIKMLTIEFGIEGEDSDPFFEDVHRNNEYYEYVQGAVEWGIVEDGAFFEGEEVASGEFIAVTAMKAIGKYRIQLYLDIEKELTNEEYFKLAYKEKLIRKGARGKGCTEEQCREILENAITLNNNIWGKEKVEISYVENVLEASSANILEYNANAELLYVKDNIVDELYEGRVIIFENGGIKYARKVVEIDGEGCVKLGVPEMEEVVENMQISSVRTVGFDNIASYYGLNDKNRVHNMASISSLIHDDYEPMYIKDNRKDGEGVSFSIIKKGDKIDIVITDCSNNISYTLPPIPEISENIIREMNKGTKDSANSEAELEAKFTLKSFEIGSQMVWNKGVEFAYVAVNADIEKEIKASISLMNDIKIPLGDFPIVLAGGMITVDVRTYLVISAEGEISIEVETPAGFGLYYERDRGFRCIGNGDKKSINKIEAAVNMEAAYRIQTVLQTLKIVDILDVEFDVGVKCEAKIVEREMMTCVDMGIVSPVITLGVLEDDEIDSWLRKKIGSLEWKICPKNDDDNTMTIKHFEVYRDGRGEKGFVPECTYQDGDVQEVINDSEIVRNEQLKRFWGYDLPLSFSLDYTEDENGCYEFSIYDKGDYYAVKGTISCLECMYDVPGIGGHFTTISGRGYTVQSEESYNNDQRFRYILLGDDGEKYEISNLPAFYLDKYSGMPYYLIASENASNCYTIYEDVLLYIDKTVRYKDAEGEGATFESSVENGDFENVQYNIAFDISFTEDGKINILTAKDLYGYKMNGGSSSMSYEMIGGSNTKYFRTRLQ